MATFPRTEAEVAALAQDIIRGLTAHLEEFPNPPIEPAELQTSFDAYLTAREAAVGSAAAAADTVAKKDEALQILSDDMKAAIRYAENTTRFDDGKLRLIGWGGRKVRTSLEVPGQPRSLETLREGDGWILLDWKNPVDGGKIAAFRIERRERANGPWDHVGTAVESEILLSRQQRGVELEYRAVAVNKAGEGRASNVVTAVL
jgi:hypothetical protein